jgi:hypothetical protein
MHQRDLQVQALFKQQVLSRMDEQQIDVLLGPAGMSSTTNSIVRSSIVVARFGFRVIRVLC